MFNSRQEFYDTVAWKRLRKYIRIKYHGVCQRCGNAGNYVHHIKHVTDKNVGDPDVTLNEDNLTLLCLDCHNFVHYGSAFMRDDVLFDEDGNLIKRENAPRSDGSL
jgi:5-methylcytosine-specific restriction endonuclease McrA